MANFDQMDAAKEEQVPPPVKLEFDPCFVEISSSSEKSSTGRSQEREEEATSSSKRSTHQQQISDEIPCKKPRLEAPTEGSHDLTGGLHRESMGLNAIANHVTDGTFSNDAIEGGNLHSDGSAADHAVNEVDVGDDNLPDDFLEPLDSPLASSPPPGMHIEEPTIRGHPSAMDMAKLMFKQFWKAGDYDNVPSMEDLDLANGMEHVRVHPKFLHSNATSHKWALGAIAELLDNSLDEAVNGATLVKVDMIRNPRDGHPMLMIEDDGGGMDPERMRQCMSLGYSAKSKVAHTIGQYGNGFKTSTMRLGADVVVFSRHKSKGGSLPTQSIGLLSYTFLTGTGQDDIIVPMVDYEVHPFGLRKLVRGTLDDWNKNLETLLEWSPYDTEKALSDQFKRIDSQGTIVIVYNLWEDDEGNLELDFDADPHDIQLRGANRDERNNLMASKYPNCRHFFTHKYSLRSYASILYLRLPKQFKMFLRGKQVVHHKVVNDLMLIEQVKYKPVKVSVKSHRDAVTVVSLGFVKDAKEHIDVQGFNVYHKNRLIKPFWRVWNYPGIQGRGIFGVLEANFVEPAHDKQGFERTTVFARLEARLIEIQKSYWSKNCEEIGYVGNASRKKTPSKADNAGDDPSSKRMTYPHVPVHTKVSTYPHVPVHTKVSLSLNNTQKSNPTASVVPEKGRVQAVQLASGQSILSVGADALPSQNTAENCAVSAALHGRPLSGNIARAASTHSLAELDREGDDQSTANLNTAAASRPSISRKALVSLDIVEAQPTSKTSRPTDSSGRVDRLSVTPCTRVTRSQTREEVRVQGLSSFSVPTVDTAQACSAEVLSRNVDDRDLHAAHGSSDGLELADKSTSSLLARTGVAVDEIQELTCAALESDSKDTQLVEHKASEVDIPSLPDGNQPTLVVRSDEPPVPHTSLTQDSETHDAARPSLNVCLRAESLQDSNEALISPSSQCEAPESSPCTSKNVPNGSLTSTKTQEGRPRLTRSMLQLRQSNAKAAQLESANPEKSGNDIQQPVIDGTSGAICIARKTPEEGDMSISTVVTNATEQTGSLESIHALKQPVIDGITGAICIARTTPEEGDTSISTLVTNAAEYTGSLESVDALEEKLDIMKQRLRSLQVDLEQIYSERDFIKGELEEERRRQSLIEEELKKRLQAVSSQAQELEVANNLLRVCQR